MPAEMSALVNYLTVGMDVSQQIDGGTWGFLEEKVGLTFYPLQVIFTAFRITC